MQHLTRSARCVRRSCARTCGVARAKLAAQCQIGGLPSWYRACLRVLQPYVEASYCRNSYRIGGQTGVAGRDAKAASLT